MTCLQNVVIPVQARAHFAVLSSAYLEMCILPKRHCVSAKHRGSRLSQNTIFSFGRRWHRKAQKGTERNGRAQMGIDCKGGTEENRMQRRHRRHRRAQMGIDCKEGTEENRMQRRQRRHRRAQTGIDCKECKGGTERYRWA